MRTWPLICLLALLGCEPKPDVPTIPPPPEDLSTWTVPELVQPPPPVPAALAAADDKATNAEKLYDWTPGTTYPALVTVGVPMDIVLERGEQVRNIVGGTVAPAAEGQA